MSAGQAEDTLLDNQAWRTARELATGSDDIVVHAGPAGAANAITDHRQFVMWVTGNLGTCWCQIDMNHSWTMAGGRVGPGVVGRVAGLSCDP